MSHESRTSEQHTHTPKRLRPQNPSLAELKHSVGTPLGEYQAQLASAVKAAKAFDDESEALDAAVNKYLSLSRDTPVELSLIHI